MRHALPLAVVKLDSVQFLPTIRMRKQALCFEYHRQEDHWLLVGRALHVLRSVIGDNCMTVLFYNLLSGKEFTLQEASRVLVEAYHIPQDQAEKDAAAWVDD